MARIAKKLLAQALLDKNTNRYANESKWGSYDYTEIYKDARYEFSEYLKRFDHELTDQELPQNFARDYWKKDPKIWEPVFGKQVDQSPPPPPKKEPAEENPTITTPPQTAGANQPSRRFKFQLPKMPASLKSAALNTGSRLSIAFQRNIGSRLSQGGIFAIAGGIGGAIGGGLISGGNPLGIAFGTGIGGALGTAGSSYLNSPEGRGFINNLGQGNANSRGNSVFRRSKKSNFRTLKILLAGSGIAFLLLTLIGGFFAPFGGPDTSTTEAPGIPAGTSTNLFVSLNGPGGCKVNCKTDNNGEITYQINLTYSGSGIADIQISGNLPEGVILARAALENWNLSSDNFSQVVSSVKSKETKVLSLTFQAIGKTDFWTSHYVLATLIPAKVELPSAQSCLSKYAKIIAKNPDQANFGDPQCDFTKDQLYDVLKQQDRSNADFWYFKVVPCESSYNPNEYYRCDSNGNNCTPDPAGAWGLFQMGRGKNGKFDQGDVIWQEQIINALNYNKTKLQPEGLSIGSYWACAR